MNIGDRVGLIHAGKTYRGHIADIFTHNVGTCEHTSLKIIVKNFMLPVIINMTLFPYRVWKIDE